jgi:pimeloyl-ACP methyl ester carboxylesterase
MRNYQPYPILTFLCFITLILEGCSSISQRSDIVKVRDPGNRIYRDEPASGKAKLEWEYAVMSANAYRDHWSKEKSVASPQLELVAVPLDQVTAGCNANSDEPLLIPGWFRWSDFPGEDPALETDANRQQLFFEVWQKGLPGEIVAIVFRGTVPGKWQTWAADFRWLIPLHEDQYTISAEKLALDFAEEISKRIANSSLIHDVQLVSVGHSLGGGLAQEMAYAWPGKPDIPRITKVYAFNPSPVTGYHSVPSAQRDINTKTLDIYRIFEHGEILAYVRLLTSYVIPPSAIDPSIFEIRYNFDSSLESVGNHSMSRLACGIVKAAAKK